MWKIKHIFDGEYGCEESSSNNILSVTLVNENDEEKIENVPDIWLTKNALDVGSEWPDYSNYQIETKDLFLKKGKQNDWNDIFLNLWSHKESAKYMLWEVTSSESEAVDRMKRTVAFQTANKYAFFIYEKKSGKAIGFAGMKEIEPGVFEDTGVALGPQFIGKGYGTQALNALLHEAKIAGGSKFIASCRKQNIPSHNLQMKCGFQFMREEKRIDPRTDEEYILEFNVKYL